MKILITGAFGHIGSHVIKNTYKIKKIKKIYLVDNISNERFNLLFEINNKKFNFIYGDLTDKKFCKRLPKTDVVLHLASITNAEKSFENKKKVFKNNLGCFKNVLDYCGRTGAKLIHISSTSVYGDQKGIVNELSKLKPLSPYAEVKRKEEIVLIKQSKVKYITLRFGTISGFSKGMRFHTAVNKFCFNAIMKLPIPVWGKALNLYRPYLSLKDAFKIIKFILSKNFFPSEIFNILSENKTVKQILDIIKKNNHKIKIKYIDSKILNQFAYKTSKEKIEKFDIKLNSKISNDIKETLIKLK